MADLNFPTNPTIGDLWTIGATTYQWNGYAWIKVSSDTLIITSGTFDTVVITSTTNVTSSTISGALQVYGGAYITKDLYVGGILYSAGEPVLTTATFVAGVQDGVDIDIVEFPGGVLEWNNISTLQSVTGRGATTTNVTYFASDVQATSTDTGAIVVTGGIGVGKRVTCESLRIADTIFDSTETLVNTTATTAIDTYSISEFRSAKYLIQIDEGIGAGADFELREILLVADNESHVWATEYGVVTSNGDLGTFQAEVTGTNVVLYFTPYAATNKTIKILRTGMAV
jgi:hypothetical protein